ncbi:DUF5677 domain-containing protein [Legionella cincinnatiensis]|uniref:Uncharacterized protein n=1 Tax=Legionella cincinnatiensis TaxID=28085 RepID=A0A378IFM3_9GAMM|nr:DUF5677 domain-containing protein [Legionella cincinnatiensis]KTC84339.1 hypothetical protein Lcin_1902 [Legionella cincinnatiensis]STX34017.1 Uncharacterised protein [Legionella cincinnatiensis]
MENENVVVKFLKAYESYLSSSFKELWSRVKIEYNKLDAYSVIGGLLSRQVTLSLEMARSPNTLNGHSAPLFLRAMTDLHITLSWMMMDLEERTKLYILHGLGDTKLLIEHYKNQIDNNPDDTNEHIEKLIEVKSAWINSQRNDFFVEVNLGHWAQLDTRKMSQESDCEDLYKFAYKTFSQSAHNMWSHVSVYNCKPCASSLHKHHLIPELFEAPLDLDYLYRSCKYVDKAYNLFINNFNLEPNFLLPLDWWDKFFQDRNDLEKANK